jgi:hypothetical protein
MSLLQICEWLERTRIAVLVSESQWGFPIVVGVHLLGLALSVGMVIWFDLRLLGVVLPDCPVSTVYRRIMPWALTGFAIMFVSGGMLFAGYATSAYGNLYFRIKVAALLVAGINAAAYHLVTERRFASLDGEARQPLPARMAGITSIVVWAVVVLAGRMISYTMF